MRIFHFETLQPLVWVPFLLMVSLQISKPEWKKPSAPAGSTQNHAGLDALITRVAEELDRTFAMPEGRDRSDALRELYASYHKEPGSLTTIAGTLENKTYVDGDSPFWALDLHLDGRPNSLLSGKYSNKVECAVNCGGEAGIKISRKIEALKNGDKVCIEASVRPSTILKSDNMMYQNLREKLWFDDCILK